MINRIVDLLVGAACVWGTWAMTHPPVDAMPT